MNESGTHKKPNTACLHSFEETKYWLPEARKSMGSGETQVKGGSGKDKEKLAGGYPKTIRGDYSVVQLPHDAPTTYQSPGQIPAAPLLLHLPANIPEKLVENPSDWDPWNMCETQVEF